MTDIYQITENDSLEDLAKKFNVSLGELLKVNNLSPNSEVEVGTKIVIPQRNDTYYNIYTVEKGDSLYKISREFNIDPVLLASLNGLDMDDYIFPNQEMLIPKSGYSYYLTAEGDTLNMVADIFKENIVKLIEENNTIYLLPGQLIVNKK